MTLIQPDLLVDLDALDDIDTVCERSVRGIRKCSDQANWIVRSKCPKCSRNGVWLLCNKHASERVAGNIVVCVRCRDAHPCRVLSLEPLR